MTDSPHPSINRVGRLAAATLIAHCGFSAPAALAEEASLPLDYGELNAALTFDPEERAPHLETPGRLNAYYDWKEKFTDDHRLPYLVEYGVIGQWGSTGADRTHLDHELNISSLWTLTDSPNLGQGTLVTWVQNSVTLAGATTTEFMQSLGVLSPVNGGDTFPDQNVTRLNLLAWEQRLPGDQWRFIVGKLTDAILLDIPHYAVSDREDFFSPMLVNNVIVPYSARVGLGVWGEYTFGENHISVMIRDADAQKDFVDFDSLSTGNWEYAIEFGWSPVIENLGPGYYRFIWHYTDAVGSGAATLPAGWAGTVGIDQDIGEKIGAYFRYAYADTPFRRFQERVAIGGQLKAPLGFADDRIGLGVWWGNPTDTALRTETGIEAFWKFRLTPNTELTPDVQLILNPAAAPDRSSVLIGGLRLRLEF